MGVSDEKHSEYLIDRFRKLGSTTTNWALLFLVALLYTWFVSIYPRAHSLKNYITVLNKEKHFDSLSKRSSHEKRHFIQSYVDSAVKEKKHDSTSFRFTNINKKLDSILKKSDLIIKDPERLKTFLDSATKLRGPAKKKLMLQVERDYLPIDILIAMSELQKRDADKQKDSLINKVAITFDVPGLETISVSFRAGLLIWMILAVVLLLYVFSTRLKLIDHMKSLFTLESKTLRGKLKEWEKLDLQVPVWLAPIMFKSCNEKKSVPSTGRLEVYWFQ